MTHTPTCQHDDGYVFYYRAINEDGWKCDGCNTQLGFRPDLDDRLLRQKVSGFVHDLHEAKFIYVSNGTMGEIITENVEGRCRTEDRFDQYAILAYILTDHSLLGDGDYWRKQRNRWLMEHPGAPPLSASRTDLDALLIDGSDGRGMQ